MARTKRGAQPQCRWTYDEDGNWETDCGQVFVLEDGTPSDNLMRFCCYCGSALRQIKAAK